MKKIYLLLGMLWLLSLSAAGCRCEDKAAPCALQGEVVDLPSPSHTPRLLSLAGDGQRAVLAWIGGKGDQARVVLQPLTAEAKPAGKPTLFGDDDAPPLLAAVAAKKGQTALAWIAGTPRKAYLSGVRIGAKGVEKPRIIGFAGPLVDPHVTFVGDTPWAVWGVTGGIWARSMAKGAPDAVPLVDRKRDAFWPLLSADSDGVSLTYLTAGKSYDFYLTEAETVPKLLAGRSRRIPRQTGMTRLEPAMAAGPTGTLLAWSLLPGRKSPTEPPQPNQVRLARLSASGQLQHFDRTLDGLAPSVAPLGPTGAVVSWIRPITTETATAALARIDDPTAKPWALRLDTADLRHGRPVVAQIEGGYIAAWIRARLPEGRQVRAAKVICK